MPIVAAIRDLWNWFTILPGLLVLAVIAVLVMAAVAALLIVDDRRRRATDAQLLAAWEADTGPRCCDSHRVNASCCDPDDCGPCCPDCPTCPTLHRLDVPRA